MPKKPNRTTRPRTTRPRRKRRTKSAGATRAAVFTVGFICTLFLVLWGLSYIKKGPDKESPNQSERIAKRLAELDNSINSGLFKIGVSSYDISSASSSKKSVEDPDSGVLEWDHDLYTIKTPGGINKSSIKTAIKRSIASMDGVGSSFRDQGDLLVADIDVNGYLARTYEFKFVSKVKPKPEAIVIEKPVKKEADPKTIKVDRTDVEEKPLPSPKPQKEISSVKTHKPKIVIIVDDLGVNKAQIDDLLRIEEQLTFAVLPDLPYSEYAANGANARGWDVMLHLPMEPKESSGYSGEDAGEDALLVGLPKQLIIDKLNKHLDAVPHIKGVNNHMGSKFMENGELLELVLSRLSEDGLFFVDSLTSNRSMGFSTAKKLDVKTASRDLFLDNKQDPEYIKAQINKLVDISEKKGYAVGICHPYPSTLKALRETLPKLKDTVDITSVSEIVH